MIRNGPLGELKGETEYELAKSGDISAAVDLVDRLLTDATVNNVKERIGGTKPLILPVLAAEDVGNNKIPLAMAEVLADRLGLRVSLDVVQNVRISRTGSGSDYRLAFNPTFEGDVRQGEECLIVDDTLTMGGTFASLKGFVENRGGKVLAASVMTAHEGALCLPVKPSMLEAIVSKHGSDIDKFWQETFGYGINKLTQGEAGHLKSARSFDEIRNRIVAARHEGIERMGARGAETPSRKIQKGVAGASLVAAAEAVEVGQQSLIESASIEQSYQESLAVYVQAKHVQVERIEDRLESLIDKQQASLQRYKSNRPGVLSMPSVRRAWQADLAQRRGRIQCLNARLELVRDIKDGAGLHSPRIEELATRKMRANNPELAANWDAMRQSERLHQEVVRQHKRGSEQPRRKTMRQRLGVDL